MIEVIIVAVVVCGSALAGLVLTLKHIEKFKKERQEWQDALHNSLLSKVDERLAEQADYRKDLEAVNTNQIRLAKELELLKTSQQLRTSMGSRLVGTQG